METMMAVFIKPEMMTKKYFIGHQDRFINRSIIKKDRENFYDKDERILPMALE